jgi:hypothetical protein
MNIDRFSIISQVSRTICAVVLYAAINPPTPNLTPPNITTTINTLVTEKKGFVRK